MSETFFNLLERTAPTACITLVDPPSKLRAFIVLDSLALGPACGGVRTRRYSTPEAGLADVLALARTMTLKSALAGVDCGGGKAVVLDHPELDRERAYAVLAKRIEALNGLFWTAGDLGTGPQQLAIMGRHTQYVLTDEPALADAVARGVERCVEACLRVAQRSQLAGLRVAVQGCGAIGTAVARRLRSRGASLIVADIDSRRAEQLAAEVEGQVCAAQDVLSADVDLVSPCAIGGVLTEDVAQSLNAWAVCGAANNILGGASVDAAATIERVMMSRGIHYVPDMVASSGAVIEGIGSSVMGLDDRAPLIDRLGETAEAVLRDSSTSGETPTTVARRMALARIETG